MMMNMNMSMMGDPALAGVHIFDSTQFYEPPKPRYIFQMPRVVPDQKEKFETDDMFKKVSRDCEIRYVGFRDKSKDDRKILFLNSCQKGFAEISFVATGINIQLAFTSNPMMYHHHHHMNFERELDFDKEHGKVHIKSHLIMNGVCVRFRGWLDLERLDGVARLEYDERRGAHEDAILKEQLERYSQRLKEFEDAKQSINVGGGGGNRGSWRQ